MPAKKDAKGGKGGKDAKGGKGGKAPAKTPKKAGAGGGKAKKKKWSKGKTKEKLNNAILFDQATYDKLVKEVPHYKLITPAVVSERLKINGSLARVALKDLTSKGLIKPVALHHAQCIYTRATAAEAK
eukprot:TRINITY_DN248_c0_g1_i1.p2 TRINITY_DN248_c0_g1~~TRINITY_DN248_c0_g1_i1.p2  ORF type:complete len:128 (-),score=34.29 TRINITY_DN248_c0_g1_i1:129-512(-)